MSTSFTKLAWINVSKDLRLEWRSRDVFNSMMFFALVVVVVFSFAFERDDSKPVMGGLIWIAFLFSTTMALNQSWARELRNGVLDAYRVSPAPAEATLYLVEFTVNAMVRIEPFDHPITPILSRSIRPRPIR